MRTGQNIYKRKDGRWEGRYFNGYDSNGKIKYISVYAKSYGEVKEKLNCIKKVTQNACTKHINIDFKSVCYEWLEAKQDIIKISSFANYKFIVKRYILPCFINKKIYEIGKTSLSDLMIKNKGLSQKSLRSISTVFKEIVSFINERYNFHIDLMPYNFTNTNSKSFNVLSKYEREKLESYLLKDTDLLKLGILLCLYTGLRIGEICAIKWSDIDLENGIIQVNKTIQRIQNTDKESKTKTKIIIDIPKTGNSIRDIPIQEHIKNILKCHKIKYNEHTYLLTGNMNYIEPRALQYKFKKYLEEAEINNINFHALRHTFATRAIESGIDIKSVSEILGHSTVSMTLEKYVHITMEHKQKEINKIITLNSLKMVK